MTENTNINKYDIEIEEILRRVITGVEASNIDEAISIVEEKYKKEEIVLDSSDFVENSFNNLYSRKLDKNMFFSLKYDATDGILTIRHEGYKEGKYVCDEARDIYRCLEVYVNDYIEQDEITADVGNKEYEEELERG